MMGVPIWAHGDVRGSIYVTGRRDGQPFDDEPALGGHAGRIVEAHWY